VYQRPGRQMLVDQHVGWAARAAGIRLTVEGHGFLRDLHDNVLRDLHDNARNFSEAVEGLIGVAGMLRSEVARFLTDRHQNIPRAGRGGFQRLVRWQRQLHPTAKCRGAMSNWGMITWMR
jgi:hypothetical protein